MIEKTSSARLGKWLHKFGLLDVFRRSMFGLSNILQGGVKRIAISTQIINDTQPAPSESAATSADSHDAAAGEVIVKGKHLWVFNPYTHWALHAAADVTIAKIASHYGAKVTYMACDSLARCCDLYRFGDREPKDRCGTCQAGTAAFLKSMDMPWVWISRYVPPAAQAHARSWVDQMLPDELPNAIHDGKPIGQWVTGSVISHQRLSFLNMANAETVRSFREYLYGSVLAYEAAKAFVEFEKPDVLLLFNGRMAFTRAVFEVAQAAGLRTIVHERGFTTSTIQFWLNETCLGNQGYWQNFRTWRDVPLTHQQANASAQWVSDRRTGKNLSWSSFVKASGDRQKVYDSLGLKPSLPVVVMLTSSDDEFVLEKDFGGIFKTQSDWVRDTIEQLRHRQDFQLVIRMHPNISGVQQNISNHDFLDAVKQLAKDLPEHIKVVWPEEQVDTYALMDSSGLGLVYGSTTGVEMSAMGKAVLLASKCSHYQQPLVTTVTSEADYPKQLNEMLAAYSMTPTLELATYSRRFIYYNMLARSVDLPGVRYKGYRDVKIDYLPDHFGQYVLKHAQTCAQMNRVLFGQGSIYPQPSDEAIARSDDAEQAVLKASLASFETSPAV